MRSCIAWPGVPLFFLIAAVSAPAAMLIVPGPQTAFPGDMIVLPVSFSSEGQASAGIQFDIQWDSPLHVQIAGGEQVGISSKTLYITSPGPQVLRCLIAGINRNTLADGVLLRILLSVDPAAAPGNAQVRITNIFATDPSGTAKTMGSGSTAIAIQDAGGGQVRQPFLSQAVLNAASLLPGVIAPGEILTVFGWFGANASVRIGGIDAPILYSGSSQVNATVPFGIDRSAPAKVEIRGNGSAPAQLSIPAAAASPALFVETGTGAGPGAILNQDYSVNSWSNPAPRGSVVMLYGTGFGGVVPPAADGQPASGPANTELAVTGSIAGVPATVLYAGTAPGLPSGVTQINVRIPAEVQPDSFAPVVLTIAGTTTQPGVTIAIR